MAYIVVKVHIYTITKRPSFSLYTGSNTFGPNTLTSFKVWAEECA